MANGAQVPEFPVSGGDLPFRNYGPIDIPADRAVVADPAHDFGIQLPSTGGSVQATLGGTIDPIPVGAAGRVRYLGVKRFCADGPISRGDEVQASNAVGKEGFVRLAPPGTPGMGRALTMASDGDEVAVVLALGKNT